MSERIVGIGTQRHTKVVCLDEPSYGGACHRYNIEGTISIGEPTVSLTEIYFQEGPIKEHGVNGCHNEDLIAIVLDRLHHFQTSEYACENNAKAINDLEDALKWLRFRTQEREARGIEGTSEK